MREFDFKNILFHDKHIGAQRMSVTASVPHTEHKHKFVELIYIYEGTGTQIIDGHKIQVKSGDFLFVNYGQTHAFSCDSKMTYIEVMFDLEFISRELINKNNAFDILTLSSFEDFYGDIQKSVIPIVSFKGEEKYVIEQILEDLLNEISNKAPLYKNIIHGYVEALFAKLIRKIFSRLDYNLENKQDVLLEIMEYINTNFSEDIYLEALATKSFYNPSYFSRIFKERFGMGFKTYIVKLRTDKAVKLLTETNMPVKSIISECGFKDENAFYRALEKWHGATPSDLRGRGFFS